MINKEKSPKHEMEFVVLNELVPADHLLRKIDKLDFSFIYEKVEHLYCQDNGRPSIDPVQLFKMMLLGYLYGIRSERRLEQEVQVNVAYRWFLGLGLRDRVPDHSTISRNRTQRFAGTGIFQEIFDEIVFQAIDHGFVDGKTLYTDSTHIKANANKNKYYKTTIKRKNQQYLEDLDASISEERKKHGKKDLPERKSEEEEKEVKVSKTDNESAYMVRDRKPRGFFYLDHRSVDAKYNITTDCYISPGNVHDSVPYLDRLDYQRKKFNFKVKNVGLDAGYFTPAICKGLIDRDIYGVMPYVRPSGQKHLFNKKDFNYQVEEDCYICPQGSKLKYKTTNRQGYNVYASDPMVCKHCKVRHLCTESKNHTRIISRHVWESYKEQINMHRFEERGKRIYVRRKETVERSFADAKELHGYRYAKYRGLEKVQEQSYMVAIAQNIKKMALLLDKQGYFNFILGYMRKIYADIGCSCDYLNQFDASRLIMEF